MLYLIIPPVIVVIGLALLVSFLLRKNIRVPFQPPDDQRKGLKTISKSAYTKASQTTLRLLEKIIKWFRLSSLKFHNISQRWFQSIREKREKIRSRKEAAASISQRKEGAGDLRKRGEEIFSSGAPAKIETPARPMISQEVVHPEARAEVRDRLEEALIERIAASPADIEAYERLGDYYTEKGNYSDALECFRQVLKLSPVHHKARIKVKRLEKMLGR